MEWKQGWQVMWAETWTAGWTGENWKETGQSEYKKTFKKIQKHGQNTTKPECDRRTSNETEKNRAVYRGTDRGNRRMIIVVGVRIMCAINQEVRNVKQGRVIGYGEVRDGQGHHAQPAHKPGELKNIIQNGRTGENKEKERKVNWEENGRHYPGTN